MRPWYLQLVNYIEFMASVPPPSVFILIEFDWALRTDAFNLAISFHIFNKVTVPGRWTDHKSLFKGVHISAARLLKSVLQSVCL